MKLVVQDGSLPGIRFRMGKREWIMPASWPVLGLIILVAALPLVHPGALLNTRGGGDSPFLLQRVQQLAAALADGHFPVRWMPDANYGYGYPFFNFYAPLSIYIPALLHLLGFSLTGAIQLAQIAGFAAAAGGVYALGQRWWGHEGASLLAAAAYTLAPFHLVNVYVRGDSLAEFWAMAWYPLVLLAGDSLAAAEGRQVGRQAALFGLSYAALVLSHNISALIFSPFLLLYLLLRWRRAALPLPRYGGRLLVGLLLGLGLAAWFWMPALAEQNLAQLGPVTTGYFHYSGHFRGLNLAQPTFLFNYDAGAADGGPFRMGLVQTLLIAAGLLAWWRQDHTASSRLPRLFVTGGLLLATFMITPLSRPLWDHLPLLPFTQFPWRFLSVQALMGALAAGGLGLWAARMDGWRGGGLLLALLLLLGLSSLGALNPDFLHLRDNDITPARLAEYEWFTGNIGSTVSAEYLPPGVQPRPYTSPWLNEGQRDAARVISGEATAQLTTRRATRQQWTITVAGSAATVRLPTLYWPGWQARLDEQPIPLTGAAGSGLMQITAPGGTHTLALTLRRTPVRRAAEALSLAALLLTLWLPRGYAKRIERRWALAAVGGVAVLAVALRVWPSPSASADNLTWDFAQMGYLHHDEAGVPFNNGAVLRAYAYSAETIAAGESLTVRLDWQTGADAASTDAAATLALYSPAVNRLAEGLAEPVAAQTQPATSGTVAYALTVPDDAPAGLFVPRLTFAGISPLLPSGQTRGDLFLRPVRVVAAATENAPPTNATLSLRLNEAAVIGPTVRLHLAWWTPQPLPGNPKVSLRWVGPDGALLEQFDTEPGYGFLPGGGWAAGAWVNDWLALALPASPLPHAILTAQLYDAGTGEVLLTRRLGELVTQADGAPIFRPTQPVYTLPTDVTPLAADFGGVIRLRGYTLAQTAERLEVTLYWEGLRAGERDYYHFVHLLDTQTGEIMVQDDAMPRRNSYPTSQWSAGEIVADGVTLDLTGVAVGRYELALGLYGKVDGGEVRMPALDATQHPLPDDRLILPVTITVP
ncbi:MAG: hypothetical protein KC418_03520 [Anaerolineales bacterium]|nr:hypothetical protein [Anaerolineales bacterium]MCB8951219.1 hypothetical protein [Ardenticatenales bacterium]